MLIDHGEIAGLVPHAGAMCLIDGVSAWDETTIACFSTSHRAACHPLARGGRLAGVHALEYGAQATAVHGGLLARAAGTAARPAYLAGLRDATLAVARLDTLAEPLAIRAWRLLAGPAGAVYRFEIRAGATPIAAARVTLATWPAAPR